MRVLEPDMELQEYIDGLDFVSSEQAIWEPGKVGFEIRAAFTQSLPPISTVTSVRCVLIQSDNIMTVTDPERIHVLPGGRIEEGESYMETLRREIGEETGYTIANSRMIGILLFKHLFSIPESWNPKHYPYFVNLVFCADAIDYDASLLEDDGYEIESNFLSFKAAKAKVSGPLNHEFIDYANSVSNK